VGLFTEEIEKKLQDQYRFGNELDQQVVVARIYNPYGEGSWYLLNQDPNDTNYVWAIVDMGKLKVGQVSKSELESTKVFPFGLPLELDKNFAEIDAYDFLRGLKQGKVYVKGEMRDKNSILPERMIVSDNDKQKTEKIKKWVKTSMINGDRVENIREASKRLKVSVSDILPHIQK